MDDKTIVAIVAIVVSGLTAIVGLALNYRVVREANILAKASRRTQAHQNLSEQEYALQRVLTECKSLQLLLSLNADRLGVAKDHLLSEAERIVSEAKEMLGDQADLRRQFDKSMVAMTSAQIEEVIAAAYQGRKRAEAQLARTVRSREDTIGMYLDKKSPSAIGDL